MAGELTIEKNADGTATINFPGGGSHKVTPSSAAPDAVKALKDAYGDRIGSVIDAPNNSGTSVDSQGQNQTGTSSSGLQVQDEYAQYVGQREGRVVDGIAIPKWVDDDYLSGYVHSVKQGNPRKPNSREMTELIAGVPVEQLYGTMELSEWTKYTNQSVALLYGSVGSNKDTRDWGAIMASDNPVVAAQIATSQMYGGTTVKYQSGGYRTDEDGNTILDANGQPEELPPALYVVGGNGTVLTGLSSNANLMSTTLQNFGVRDASWIEAASQAMGSDVLSRYQNAFDTLSASYNPWVGFESMWDMEFTTGVAPFIDPFKIVSGLGKPKAATPGETTGVVEQTITAPEAPAVGTTTEVTQPTYTGTPQAAEAVPVSTTPYTPTPTTVTGQPVATGITGTGVYPQAPVSGTMGVPLQTAGIGTVPQTIQAVSDYTGTTIPNLTSQSQKGFGGQRTYGNQFGQRITVTVDGQGNPITYVPPGYTPTQGQAKGGDVGQSETEALFTIAKMNGYKGPKSGNALKAFFNSSDALKAKARAIGVAMNKGGAVLYAAEGIDVQPGTSIDPSFATELATQTKDLIGQTITPQQSAVQYIQPEAADFIAPTAGQAATVSPMAQAATVGTVQQAQMPMMAAPATMGAITAAPSIQAETDALQAQTGTVSPQAQVDAQQQLTTSVSGMEAAQGTATMVNAPAAREIQQGEIISGVADAEKAAQFNEQIQAATATPSKQATVAGQLESLMQQFEGGATPAWAAGSMRTAMQTLAARGLGASSLAGQAVIQATMEAALPIAQMDAQTMAQFESQNLSNRQQRAMMAAQQRAQFLGQEFDQAFQARVQNSARIGDIANMNFTAEQNIALENSRAANTMNLNNLSNRQAMVMAEAAALSQLDMANLNNRQQAAVQNAQNFLQMDMANLNNEQQTAMFKAQQNIQALFTDQAAENAAEQFNATSENQTNQFFANLSSQTSQFNAAQQNAMDQFNVNSVNALREFNSELQQQRDLFNAQNGLVVAQANAQWRQNIATLNTAAQNESNMNFAKTMNAFTSTNLDAYWQRERDIMSFAFTSAENAAARMSEVLLAEMNAEAKAAYADQQGKGILGATLLKGALNYMATGGAGNIV
jgi:hypothetical protein